MGAEGFHAVHLLDQKGKMILCIDKLDPIKASAASLLGEALDGGCLGTFLGKDNRNLWYV